MSKNIIVPEGVYIVSETDLSGRITHINQSFADITGYSEDEVIGKPHNILRHPDMPKEAFKEMWGVIESGRTWRGFVKNLAKNGDYYWVYATVSPIDRIDGFKGYTSIRQRMSQLEIDKAERSLLEYKKAKED